MVLYCFYERCEADRLLPFPHNMCVLYCRNNDFLLALCLLLVIYTRSNVVLLGFSVLFVVDVISGAVLFLGFAYMLLSPRHCFISVNLEVAEWPPFGKELFICSYYDTSICNIMK